MAKNEFEMWLDDIKWIANSSGLDGDYLLKSMTIAEWSEWYEEGFTPMEAYKESMRND